MAAVVAEMSTDFSDRWGDGTDPFVYVKGKGGRRQGILPDVWLAHALDWRYKSLDLLKRVVPNEDVSGESKIDESQAESLWAKVVARATDIEVQRREERREAAVIHPAAAPPSARSASSSTTSRKAKASCASCRALNKLQAEEEG